MGSWLLGIALLVAMVVAFFLGFWMFVPILLVPFFLVFIQAATRGSMRRRALTREARPAPVVVRRQETVQDVYDRRGPVRTGSGFGESEPAGAPRGSADRFEDAYEGEIDVRRERTYRTPDDRSPPAGSDTLH